MKTCREFMIAVFLIENEHEEPSRVVDARHAVSID